MTQSDSQFQPYVTSLTAKLENTSGPVYSLDWSPDSHLIASAGYGQFQIWDSVSGKEITSIPGHTNFVWGLAWSPDGTTLACAGADGFVRWWDTATWLKTGEQETGWALCVAWSPDGKWLASGHFSGQSPEGSYTGKSQIWNGATHELVREQEMPSLVVSTAWSPDGRMLAVGLWNGSIVLWDGVSGTAQMTLTATIERSDVNGLAWSPDGKLLAAAHQDGRLSVWEPGTGSIVKTLASRAGWLRGVTWSRDGKVLAAAGEAAEVYVWQYDNGDRLACLSPECRLPAWSLKWSLDGKFLAVGDGIYDTAPIGGKELVYQMQR